MASNHHSHHEIDYIEFEVTDMAQSQRFYEAAFDWKFNDYGPGYAGIQKREGGEAGGPHNEGVNLSARFARRRLRPVRYLHS